MGYILYNCKIVTGEEIFDGILHVSGEKIEKIWKTDDGETSVDAIKEEYKEENLVDLDGKYLFAGGIDAHVHFREPGMTHKGDMASESAAALKGGVTSFMDMPNTNPPTISASRLREKLERAEKTSFANYGFHIGATDSNADELEKICGEGYGGVTVKDFAGIKVFMGSSTGNMLVNDDRTLERLFKIRNKEILVHCEDEMTIRKGLKEAEEKFGKDIPFSAHKDIRSRRACILSSIRALENAMKFGTRLHLLHVSTKEEAEMVRAAKLSSMKISAETSVNYLWFCDKDYDRLGSRLKCNPSIKEEEDRQALREALKNGTIDTVGTDHAPHLKSEKENGYLTAPSGLPSIQFALPALLTIAAKEDISLSRIASAFSEKTATLFGIEGRGFIREGYFADIVIADLNGKSHVTPETIAGKCGWSPYEGCTFDCKITDVFLNGVHVVSEGKLISSSPSGKKLIFNK